MKRRDPYEVVSSLADKDRLVEADVISIDTITRTARIRLRTTAEVVSVHLGDVDPYNVSDERAGVLVYITAGGRVVPLQTLQTKPTLASNPSLTLGDRFGSTRWSLRNSALEEIFWIDSLGRTPLSATYGSYWTYLESDDYVRRDGTTPMTNNWDAGEYEIESKYFDAHTEFRFVGNHVLSAPNTNIRVGDAGAQLAQAGATSWGSTAIGYQAGYSGVGYYTTLVGYKAGYALNTGSSENVIVGYAAGEDGTDLSFATLIGAFAGGDLTTQYNATFVGYAAGSYAEGEDCTYIGAYAGNYNDGGYNVCVGMDAGRGKNVSSTDYDQCVYVGNDAGLYVTTGDRNVVIGAYAGRGDSGGSNYQNNVLIGYSAGYYSTTGYLNVAIGNQTGFELTSGVGNTFIGADAGGDCQTGDYNIFIGYGAGKTNSGIDQSGDYNIGIGVTLASSLTSGAKNILIGYATGDNLTTQDNNVFIGYSAGSNSSSSSSVFIGYQAGKNESNSNRLYIENSDSSTPLIYGEFDNDLLIINGTLRAGQLLSLGTSPTLTISGGVITVTKSNHRVDTQGAAGTDDLDTISGGEDGAILIIAPANSARTVVAKNATGNLYLTGDCTLDNTNDTLMLLCRGNWWVELSRSNNASDMGIVSGSITADATIAGPVPQSITADAAVRATISGSVTIDAYLVKSHTEASVTADATIFKIPTASITVDANIFKVVEVGFSADAYIRKVISGSFTADAIISHGGSITVDANIYNTVSWDFTADAMVKSTQSGSFTADATIT
jgi:hypothetical protein